MAPFLTSFLEFARPLKEDESFGNDSLSWENVFFNNLPAEDVDDDDDDDDDMNVNDDLDVTTKKERKKRNINSSLSLRQRRR